MGGKARKVDQACEARRPVQSRLRLLPKGKPGGRMTRLALAFQVAPITLAAILTAPAVLHADTLTGSIVDAQGLALVNANIRLLDRTSGEQRSTVSGKDGGYSFDGIRAGMYVIEADAADSALIGSQEVSVRGHQMLNLTLKIAAAQSA